MNQGFSQRDLVTIGMPVYNGAFYIKKALDSLLSQTYQNFELLISDNASTDETSNICQEYTRKDSRIRYFRQQRLGTPTENFRFVLERAQGFYFMWASHDDVWDAHFLQECVTFFLRSPHLIMVFCNFVYMDGQGKIIKMHDPHAFFPFGKDQYEQLKRFLVLLHHDGKANLLYGLWKCGVVRGVEFQLVDNWKKWGADANFVFRMLLKGPFGFTDRTSFFKRVYPRKRARLKSMLIKVFYPFLLSLTPYLHTYLRDVLERKGYPFFRRLTLLGYILFIWLRLFFTYRI